MPGIDQLPVGRGLAAERREPGAVQKSLGERMAGQGLVEARDRGRGAGERGGQDHRVRRRGARQAAEGRPIDAIRRHQGRHPGGRGPARFRRRSRWKSGRRGSAGGSGGVTGK
jgi:hypothetical protein